MSLQLRPLRGEDEAAFAEAHRLLADEDFSFGLFYEPAQPWPSYLEWLEDQRWLRNVPDGLVASSFLVAVAGEVIVGRSSIRYDLNEFLAREGGHIGYAVLPDYRRRGYASEILRQSLIVIRALGVSRVLVTCDDDNIGSMIVIERCGGVLDSVVDTLHGVPKRRYWIG